MKRKCREYFKFTIDYLKNYLNLTNNNIIM